MIRILVGLILGALGGIAYARSPQFQRQLGGKGKRLKALGEGFRFPHPSTVVELPMDQEDMTLLDEVICTCAANLRDAQPEVFQDQEAVIRVLQLCSATELYAPEEVPWPPVPGDHPTIHQLWGILGFRARRLVIRGELDQVCPAATPQPFPETG